MQRQNGEKEKKLFTDQEYQRRLASLRLTNNDLLFFMLKLFYSQRDYGGEGHLSLHLHLYAQYSLLLKLCLLLFWAAIWSRGHHG